jgi:integrase
LLLLKRNLENRSNEMAELSPLRRRMIEDMTIRNLSPATQRSYVHAVAKFSRYFGRSPDRLDLEDVRAFQVHLVANGISWPALNQTVCALRFFYGVTLGHADIPERIVYARAPRTLPVVLSADEVVRFLEAVPSLKTRTALATAYAAGLRGSETVGLKVGDIDSGRGVIRVEHGKGGKDRTVMLSAQLLRILRVYWRLAKPQGWLFLGASGRRHRQAGDGPHAQAQLRHASARERHRHPHHPGSARPQQPILDGALHQGLERAHPPHAKPARPAERRGRSAGLTGSTHVGETGGGGYLPPPW